MLNNTAYKLKIKKKLNVAYFGGSITQGAGSSDAKLYSYRARTTEYLRSRFPKSDVTEIYAAIGGTGTGLGMFRLKRDVLRFSPDLVFIEFAVNDFGDDTERISRQTESIVRHIRRASPFCDIVLLFSTSEEVVDILNAGGVFSSREAQRSVAEHYQIDSVDLGEALRAHIAETGESYVRYAPDTLHPNDDGYLIFAECLAKYLDKALSITPDALTPHVLPEKLHPASANYADIIEFPSLDGVTLAGFELKNEKYDLFNSFVRSSEECGEIRFTFKGKALGFCRLDGANSPELFVQIDETQEVKLHDPNSVVRSFEKMSAVMIPHELCDKVHSVRLRSTSETGSLVIGGIYVASDEL